MRTFMVLLLFLFLFGCTSSYQKEALDKVHDAYKALEDFSGVPIEISKTDWLCYKAIYDDESSEIGCYYYIHYNYSSSNIMRYAEVWVVEATWLDSYEIDVFVFQDANSLKAIYDEEVDSFKNFDISSTSIESINYELGSFSQRRIRKIINEVFE